MAKITQSEQTGIKLTEEEPEKKKTASVNGAFTVHAEDGEDARAVATSFLDWIEGQRKEFGLHIVTHRVDCTDYPPWDRTMK